MRMYDLITKKKRGEPLAASEIRAMVEGFTKGEIPDYQMAAMLMAICFRSMTEEEMRALTLAMAASATRAAPSTSSNPFRAFRRRSRAKTFSPS